MRLISLMLLLVLSAHTLTAQTELTRVASQQSSAVKKDGYELIWRSLGADDRYTYFASSSFGSFKKNPRVIVRAVSSDLQDTREVRIPLTFENKNIIPEAISLTEGKINLFTSFNNRRQNASYLLLHQIDTKSLTAPEAPTPLFKLNGADRNRGSYWTIYPPENDRQRHVVKYLVDRKHGKVDAHLVVLDEELQPDFEHVIDGLSDDEYDNLSVGAATSSGRLYYTTSEGGDPRRVGVDPGQRFLHLVDRNGQERHQQLTVLTGEIGSPNVTIRPSDGRVLATGKVFDRENETFAGLYFHHYDGLTLAPTTTEVRSIAPNDRDLLVLSDNLRNYSKSTRSLMEFYRPRKMYFTPDGGTYVVGYSQSFRTETSMDGRRTVQYRQLYGVIVTYLEPDGSVGFIRHIPMEAREPDSQSVLTQYSDGVGGVCFGEKLLVGFYDHTKNLTNFEEKARGNIAHLFNWKTVRYVMFSPDGDYRESTDRRFSEDRTNILPIAHATLGPSGNRAFTMAINRKKLYFVKIEATQPR